MLMGTENEAQSQVAMLTVSAQVTEAALSIVKMQGTWTHKCRALWPFLAQGYA